MLFIIQITFTIERFRMVDKEGVLQMFVHLL